MKQHTDSDQFILSPNASYYLAFLDVGHSSDDACFLASYAEANPAKLLEDCKVSVARAWAKERFGADYVGTQ